MEPLQRAADVFILIVSESVFYSYIDPTRIKRGTMHPHQLRWILTHIVTFAFFTSRCWSLSVPKPVEGMRDLASKSTMDRRASIKSIFLNSLCIAIVAPSNADAVADEGIATVTDSSIGKGFRRSAIQGARIIDNLDEKWERFSDSLRDKNMCDENTGRRLFDNGFRRDGTRVGNPVLGSLCNPQPLLPFDSTMAEKILDLAVISAVTSNSYGSIKLDSLQDSIRETEDLVRTSFERNIQSSGNEEEKKHKSFNFKFYSKMRAISNFMPNKDDQASVKKFQLTWGNKLVSELAPSADRNDYSSPFPEIKDEFEDYDYDKGDLLDALGTVKVALDNLRNAGIIGYFEISIPYDDYGSVVTVAIDDYVPISAEILLSEQNYSIGGPASAIIKSAMDKAKIAFSLNSFYLDPSTTKQDIYNPSQLLLSLNNLRKI